ncbi:MAG TPA: insulinase family protein [Bacillota bacterium]|nr:insulinase family protein [Bacillota bacterium]HOL10116.1 insulinase family protein [Bacillota bacterium]HPO97888.1 insulinase family protein [Bacillota bacterium]
MTRKLLIFALILSLTIVTFLPVAAEKGSVVERTSVSGMTILLEKNDSQLVEIALLLKSGSGLDPVGKKGTAELMNNFIRIRFRNAENKYGQIALETYPEFTLVRIRVAPANLKLALQDIKELFSIPVYSYDIITDLKKLAESELKAIPSIVKAYFTFNKEFYGVDHPYNEYLDAQAISNITGSDVYRWYRQTYQPSNALLSISGNVKLGIKDLHKFFANMITESVDKRLSIQPAVVKANKSVTDVDPNGRVVSFVMGFAAPRIQDPEYPAFRIIAYYLGDYQHYFEEVRVKEGLMYADSIYYNYIEKAKSPNIVFLTTTDPQLVERVTEKTLEVVNRLIQEGIDEQIIKRIVNNIKLRVDSRKKSGRDKAVVNVLTHYLQSQLVDDELLLKELEKVTPADIKAAAGKYFTNYIKVVYQPKVKAEHF